MEAKQELELLKTVFKDNEHLAKLLRRLFFGFELTEEEKAIVKTTFSTPEIKEALRKKFYSKFGDDAALGNIADQWASISDEKLIGASRDTITQITASKARVNEMLEKAMALIENPDGMKVDLSYDGVNASNSDPLGVKLLARNKYLNIIEGSLSMIYQICNMPEPTEEELKSKKKKDSSK
jgi:hypothetical protein